MVYIVSYDLNRPGQDYSGLHRELNTFAWAKLGGSAYAVETELSAQQLRERLQPHVDANDRLYVLSVHLPWSGFGPNEVNQWLSLRVTDCTLAA